MKEFEIVDKYLGICGRLLSGSKAGYKGNAVFNANLCTKEKKIWFGDIDLDKDRSKLQSIANEIGTIYVLREMDGRFENEASPLLNKAVLVVEPAPTEEKAE